MAIAKQKRTWISLGIILASLGLTYIPLPESQREIVVVSGTELQEPLQELETIFEQTYPAIDLELKFQGSQDIVNNYIDQKNDFTPTVIIPANQEILEELTSRWQATNNNQPFYDTPQPIVKTVLVGIAWSERGNILFPNNNFSWQEIERAMEKRNWGEIGGQANWGSFDFVITDPTRSNSGQLTLSLWTQERNNNTINPAVFNNAATQSLFTLVKNSVYQPPRSTDILLQEFISRGANDADVAMVYESIALYRWSQAQTTQGKPYQIYYPNPTIETTATAAIVRRDVDRKTAEAGEQFITFLTQPEQQEVFVKYGFRPVVDNLDLTAINNSPWAQNIPGAMVDYSIKVEQPPEPMVIGEIKRLWSRVN